MHPRNEPTQAANSAEPLYGILACPFQHGPNAAIRQVT